MLVKYSPNSSISRINWDEFKVINEIVWITALHCKNSIWLNLIKYPKFWPDRVQMNQSEVILGRGIYQNTWISWDVSFEFEINI